MPTKTKPLTEALLYVRVSTEEQAKGPLNLQNQEKKCRDECVRSGLSVAEIFVDAGESARSSDRPEFQRMLQLCKREQRKVGYVVIQDLSRLARNLQDQVETISLLEQYGIAVLSVEDGILGNTATAKFLANSKGTFNQFFSDQLSEKMRDRTRAAVLAGRYPWPAPIGYINIKAKSGGPNIVPDPLRAPLVRQAFELMETGRYTRAEVLRAITKLGLRTRKNRCLSPQTFHAMLQKRVYHGLIAPPSHEDLCVPGLHDALITEELFNRVQQVMNGKKASVAPKRKHNPRLPLKWFVKCAGCGTPLTGGFPRGRGQKTYGRYWCRRTECKATKVSKMKLEAEFLALLQRLQPNEATVASFPRIAAKVWAQKRGNAEVEGKRLMSKREDIRQLKSALLKAKLRGEVSNADYQQANAEFVDEIGELEQQLEVIASSQATLESFVRFAELMLADIAAAWQRANPEQRQRVQNLLFPEGISYSPKEGFLNRSNSSLFNVLEEMGSEKGMLASPTGFEPVLPP